MQEAVAARPRNANIVVYEGLGRIISTNRDQ
jgi:hypothetical protein